MNIKRPIRWIGTLLAIALLTFASVVTMLYLPPVQDIASGWIATWLTSRTGIQITVEKVRLRFPLRLELQGLRAGRVLHIEYMSTHIPLRPLTQGTVKANHVNAKGIEYQINTQASISAQCFRTDNVVYNPHEHNVHIHRVLLDSCHATLYSPLSPQSQDSIPDRLPLSLTIDDIRLLRTGVSYIGEQVKVGGGASRIELQNVAVDTIIQLSLQNAEIENGELTMEQENGTRWELTRLNALADSLHYTETGTAGKLKRLTFKGPNGINIQEGAAAFVLRDGAISLPHFTFHTEHSSLDGHLRTLTYSTGDMFIDGNADLRIGHADVRFLTECTDAIPEEYLRHYPHETLSCSITLKGSMQQLQLARCDISLPTVFSLRVRGHAQHLDIPLRRAAQCRYEMRTYNLGFLTAHAKDSILRIPSNATCRGDIHYSTDTIHTRCVLTLDGGHASIEGGYTHTRRAYTLKLQTDSFDMRYITPDSGIGVVSVQAQVEGNGSSYDNTSLRGMLQLRTLQWSDYTFTNATAQICMVDKRLYAHATYSDTLMRWNIAASAKYDSDTIEAQLNAQIAHLNLRALHLTETDITPSLRCHATLRAEADSAYSLRAYLSDIALGTPKQHIRTRPLSLQAMLTPDTAQLAIHSGDLTLKGSAHTEGLPWHWKPTHPFTENLTHLQATLMADDDNPVTSYLALRGIGTDSIKLTAHYTDGTLHAQLQSGALTWHTPQMKLQGRVSGAFTWSNDFTPNNLSGILNLSAIQYVVPAYDLRLFTSDTLSIPFERGALALKDLPLYTTGNQPLLLNGKVLLFGGPPTAHLRLSTSGTNLLQPQAAHGALLYGKAIVSGSIALDGPFNNLSLAGDLHLRSGSSIHYTYRDAILTANNQLDNVVTFVRLEEENAQEMRPITRLGANGLSMNLNLHIDPTVLLDISLGASQQNRISLQGEGMLNLQYNTATNLRLSGKYTIGAGNLSMNIPLLHATNMTIRQGSTIIWSGTPKNPMLDITAEDRIRASVTIDGSPQSVVFVTGISLADTLERLNLQFTLTAPENASMQNQLATLSPEERGKLAVALLTTGLYLGEGGTGNLMNTALMSMLQAQLDNLSRDAFRTVDVSVGIEPLPDGVNGVITRTDYSFSIAKRLWDNRIRIIIGGSVTTTGDRIEEDAIIDNISIEWRINPIGNQYLRFFYEKNFENILEGELRETGVGYMYRRRF